MYPLALSVINDSASYDARRQAARKLLEGYFDRDAYRRDIRALCALKARDERAAFGVKIKPADITVHAREVADYMLAHERETIAARYPAGARCHAIIRRWWDKINGVSYFTVTVRVPQDGGTFTLVKVPFQNGYGSHPEWVAAGALVELGLFPRAAPDSPRMYPIDFEDQGYMRKGQL